MKRRYIIRESTVERYTNFYRVECDESEIDAIAMQIESGTYGEANDRECDDVETTSVSVTLDSVKENGVT